MYSLFYNCRNLLRANLSGWQSASLCEVSGMFRNCSKLQITDNDMYANMFYNVSAEATIIVKQDQQDWFQNIAKFPGSIQTI